MGGTSSKLDIAAVIVSNNADKCNHSILWLQQQNTIFIGYKQSKELTNLFKIVPSRYTFDGKIYLQKHLCKIFDKIKRNCFRS